MDCFPLGVDEFIVNKNSMQLLISANVIKRIHFAAQQLLVAFVDFFLSRSGL